VTVLGPEYCECLAAAAKSEWNAVLLFVYFSSFLHSLVLLRRDIDFAIEEDYKET